MKIFIYTIILLMFFATGLYARNYIKIGNMTPESVDKPLAPAPKPTTHKSNNTNNNTFLTNTTMRTWHTITGKKATAKMLSFNAENVFLILSNGKKVKVAKQKLSKTDNLYMDYYEKHNKEPSKILIGIIFIVGTIILINIFRK